MKVMSIFSHFKSDNIVEWDEDHICYRHFTRSGEGTASVYPVLPGIEIIKLDFHSSEYIPSVEKVKGIVEISHCLEGRTECLMPDNCYHYIDEGDLLMHTLQYHSDNVKLPQGYYHGMVVMIDLDAAAASVSDLIPNNPINVYDLFNRYFSINECFLIQANDTIQHVFLGMYTIHPEARSVYYRLKVMELLLNLHYFNPAEEKQKKAYTRPLVDSVKQIHKIITGDLKRHFSIEELSKEYFISPTTLKTYFKNIYGDSISTYMKQYRIKQAVSFLLRTQKSIAEIAADVGYSSQSKFGIYFKEIMQITPYEYRKKFAHKSV